MTLPTLSRAQAAMLAGGVVLAAVIALAVWINTGNDAPANPATEQIQQQVDAAVREAPALEHEGAGKVKEAHDRLATADTHRAERRAIRRNAASRVAEIRALPDDPDRLARELREQRLRTDAAIERARRAADGGGGEAHY